MIDSRIPMMGQQQDSFGNIAQGLQMGQGLRQLLSGRQAGKMAQIKDENERQSFADNSMFSRELNSQLKANNATQLAQAMALQKHNADIGKTQSEAFKNNTQGQGFGLDNSGKKLGAIQGAFQQASLTGDKAQVLLGMNALVRTGMMSLEDYQSQAAIVNAMTPDELKQYAGGINFANAKDPAALQYQSADNAATNQTTQRGQDITSQTAMRGQDIGAETADKNREQQGQQFNKSYYLDQQKAYFDQKKPIGQGVDVRGRKYNILADGRSVYIKDEKGGYITERSEGSSAIKQLEHKEKALNYEEAATSAREAATLARTLADDANGLSKTTGGYGIMAKLPGTVAKDYSQRVETLKSQVFLTQIEKMKGMGALTDAEGARLEKAIASLDINQGEKQFKANLEEIERVLLRAEQNAFKRAQIYNGGGQDVFDLFD